jgi:hypothetical protein
VAKQHGFKYEEQEGSEVPGKMAEEKSKMDKRLMHNKLEMGLA